MCFERWKTCHLLKEHVDSLYTVILEILISNMQIYIHTHKCRGNVIITAALTVFKMKNAISAGQMASWNYYWGNVYRPFTQLLLSCQCIATTLLHSTVDLVNVKTESHKTSCSNVPCVMSILLYLLVNLTYWSTVIWCEDIKAATECHACTEI